MDWRDASELRWLRVGCIPTYGWVAPAIPGERWARVTAEVERLTRAAATTLWVDADHHVAMVDLEGSELCVA